LIIEDLLKVIYAPKQAFKRIIASPKYMGVIIIFILFIGLQIGYEYTQYSKFQLERTSPPINALSNFTNAVNWTTSSGTNITNNFSDYFNYTIVVAISPIEPAIFPQPGFVYAYYPDLFGNRSLQISSSNTTSTIAALSNFDVNCDEIGFQNLTLIIKQTQPKTTPQNATLTLYSLDDTNYFQYNLKPQLLDSSNLAQWNNLTIPVGKNAQGWSINGSPTWSNITALTLQFNFSSTTNVTINIGALYFQGQYITTNQIDSTALVMISLQQFSLQFLATWGLFTGVLFVFLKVFKAQVIWKPLFIVSGFALFIMVIRGIVNVIAAIALPSIYTTFDSLPGYSLTPYGALFYPTQLSGSLFAQSQVIVASNAALTATFFWITTVIFFISYIWLAILEVIIIGEFKPEIALPKRIGISMVTIVIVVFVLILTQIGA